MKRTFVYLMIISVIGVCLAAIYAQSIRQSRSERSAANALAAAGDPASDTQGATIEKTLAETGFILGVAELLESNKVRDAKAILGSRLDGNIIAIDLMTATASAEAGRTGTNLLKRIAEFRKHHPVNYHNTIVPLGSNEIATINAKVNSILKKHEK